MASLKSKPAAGYCKLHKRILRFCEIKEHGCIDRKKQKGKPKCSHLVKYDTHPFWAESEKLKEERKASKKQKKLSQLVATEV